MRWPIRNQILLPFAAVVLLAIVALTSVAAVLAARRSEQQTLAQLQNTIDTLVHANFPLTAPVLRKMHGLSGAHFVACDDAGRIVASTLPPGTGPVPEPLRRATADNLGSLAGQPAIDVGGSTYLAARLEPRGDVQARSLLVLFPVDRLSRDRREAALLPLMVGGPALVLTAIVAIGLAQKFSRRLRRLEAQVSAIAGGDFREIPQSGQRDEIDDLVTSVNRMAAQLRQMQRTIRQSEQTRLLAQLAGGLAHHLRNAVAGARLALQLHQRRCVAAPADQSLEVALRQLSLTETQVRGLLSLGKGERSAAGPCDVSRLAAEIRALLDPACEHAHVALEVDAGTAEGLVVSANLEELRAVVLNLALNAVEAAGPGGAVRLGVAREGDQAVIEVCDSGSGPPAEVAGSLFEPFVTTKPEGVGLGLALARQVAQEYGGALAWLRRDGWTVFRLSLPAARRAMEAAVRPPGGAHRAVELQNPEPEAVPLT